MFVVCLFGVALPRHVFVTSTTTKKNNEQNSDVIGNLCIEDLMKDGER